MEDYRRVKLLWSKVKSASLMIARKCHCCYSIITLISCRKGIEHDLFMLFSDMIIIIALNRNKTWDRCLSLLWAMKHRNIEVHCFALSTSNQESIQVYFDVLEQDYFLRFLWRIQNSRYGIKSINPKQQAFSILILSEHRSCWRLQIDIEHKSHPYIWLHWSRNGF